MACKRNGWIFPTLQDPRGGTCILECKSYGQHKKFAEWLLGGALTTFPSIYGISQ